MIPSASQTSTSSLSLPPDTYIFDIAAIPGTAYLAAISSDDSLRIVDAATLNEVSHPKIGLAVHAGVTRLHAIDQAGEVLTAGRDGLAKLWDLRDDAAAQMEFRDGKIRVKRRF